MSNRPESSDAVRVLVRNGSVESRQYSFSGTAVAAQYVQYYPAVNGLFALIADAIGKGQLADVQYDAESGYPRKITLDLDGPGVTGADGEIGIDALLVEMASGPPR